jgi:hypothetical protein
MGVSAPAERDASLAGPSAADAGVSAAVGSAVPQPDGGLGLQVAIAGLNDACPGQCQELMAEVTGGSGRYELRWNMELSGPGPHRVCPSAETRYTVTVDDIGAGAAASSRSSASAELIVSPDKAQCGHGRELCAYRSQIPVTGSAWSDDSNSFVSGLTAEDLAGLVQVGADGSIVFAIGGEGVPSDEDGIVRGFRGIEVGKLDSNCVPLWSRRIAPDDPGGVWPMGLALDSRSRVVVSGAFDGELEFGASRLNAGEGRLFALQLDADGTPGWAVQFGHESDGYLEPYPEYTARATIGPNDELFVYGYARSTELGTLSIAGALPECGRDDPPGGSTLCGYMMKLDLTTGAMEQARRFAAPSFIGSVRVDRAGALLFSATVRLEWVDGSTDRGGHLLAKLNPSTERLWSAVVVPPPPSNRNRTMGYDWHWDRALAIDPDDNILYLGQLHDGSEPEILRLLTDPGPWRIARFSKDGDSLWAPELAQWQVGTPAAVTAGPRGEAIVAGHFSGAADFGSGPVQAAGGRDGFVVQLDAGGRPLWAQSYGGDADDFLGSVAADADGNVWIAGFSGETMPRGSTRKSVTPARPSLPSSAHSSARGCKPGMGGAGQGTADARTLEAAMQIEADGSA